MSKQPVIIAGAGPVGLITALILARNDVPVLVLEAEPGLTHDLRAGTFHPPTQELMEPLGITARMHEEFVKVLKMPAVRERLEQQGMSIRASSPEEFSKFVAAEIARWGKVVRENKIQAGE